MSKICQSSASLNDELKAWPSTDTLADDLDATRQGVQRAAGLLNRLGYLRIERGGGAGRSNRYWAVYPGTDIELTPGRVGYVRKNCNASVAVSPPKQQRQRSKTATSTPENCNVQASKTATPARPEPSSKEPLKEPIPPSADARDARAPPFKESSQEESGKKEVRQDEASKAGKVHAPAGSLLLSRWNTYSLQRDGKSLPRDEHGGCWVDAEEPPPFHGHASRARSAAQ